MSHPPQSLLRHIPKVDRLLQEPEVEALVDRYGRLAVVGAVRDAAEALRQRVLSGDPGVPSNGDMLPFLRNDVAERVEAASRRTLRRAINATGIVLHTGLGRAVLSEAAAEAVSEVARGHSLLEVDPESGERGSRQAHVAGLLRELTGAQDGIAVNNNAAAVFLAVAVLAAGKEVIISRGQLVEIGGAFRIPDVIRSAGARLVEVGTTNRTRISDYAQAITSETALLLRVHPSNFRMVGFTEEPELAEMVALGAQHGISVMDDLGSGALVDLTRYGLVAEPTVHASIAAGAQVVTFSGDKLLGGSQAGLIIGESAALGRMKRHPLMRVLRVGKLTIAALEATLRLYRDEAAAVRAIPTLSALTSDGGDLESRARRFGSALEALGLSVNLEPGISQVGGGSLPGEALPTTLVCVSAPDCSAGEMARRLRMGEPSIWGRISKDRLVLDLRTVRPDEEEEMAAALRIALQR